MIQLEQFVLDQAYLLVIVMKQAVRYKNSYLITHITLDNFDSVFYLSLAMVTIVDWILIAMAVLMKCLAAQVLTA